MDPFDRDPAVRYGVPEPVAPGVRRITAQNPSPFTFTGTRSYLVGGAGQGGDGHGGEVVLIDPGPDDPAHVAAILGALAPGERIGHVLVTHSHRDHSGAVPAIVAATGAPVLAFGPHGAGLSETMRRLAASGAALGGGEGGDPGFVPDRTLADGEAVEGPGRRPAWRLTALHTPGHLSNHLSFALDGPGEMAGIVFTGDTVMGFATTLVSPPDGDMAAFMASLARLAARGDRLYLPGHGHPVRDPARMLAWQMRHRQERLDQILAALGRGPSDAAGLARAIYTEVEPALLPAATRNVLASLIGLSDQGRVACEGPVAADAVFQLA